MKIKIKRINKYSGIFISIILLLFVLFISYQKQDISYLISFLDGKSVEISVNEFFPEEVDGEVVDSQVSKENVLGIMDSNNIQYYVVEKVVDGDTIKVKDIGVIRLIGVDTPETKDSRKPVQCFGQEASEKTEEILLGKKVKLEFDETQGELDKYGRILAYVYTEDGMFLNYELIKGGFAHEYTYKTPYKYQTDFKDAENFAEKNKIGLWGDACN